MPQLLQDLIDRAVQAVRRFGGADAGAPRQPFCHLRLPHYALHCNSRDCRASSGVDNQIFEIAIFAFGNKLKKCCDWNEMNRF
jgi:hypothetical protein